MWNIIIIWGNKPVKCNGKEENKISRECKNNGFEDNGQLYRAFQRHTSPIRFP